MLKSPLLHTLMGLPQYLLDCYEPLDSSVYDESRAPELDAEVDSYYDNDRHITGAAVHLHPLLYKTEALRALRGVFRSSETVHTIYELKQSAAEAKVYLVLAGSLRLVTENEDKRCVEIGQYRPGQWIGMPSLLREFDERDPDKRWTRPITTTIKAIPIGDGVTAQSILLTDFLNLMRGYPDLVRYVRQHVAVRFAHRERILARLKQNPICRVLPPGDIEYLMQLGVLRRASVSRAAPTESMPYLPANKPSHRAALVLEGKCSAYLPITDPKWAQRGEKERYVGKFGEADLVGHEGIVMPEEQVLASSTAHAPETTPEAEIAIREPPRLTTVYATPETEVLEFFWYAFRWALDDRMATWSRIIKQIVPAHYAGRIPEVIAVQSARRQLGTTTLTQGLALALTQKTGDRVCVLDLDGANRFRHQFGSLGFTAEPEEKYLEPTIRARRAGHRTPAIVKYRKLVPPQNDSYWPPDVHLIWPENNADADTTKNLLEILQTESEYRFVILCIQQDAESSDKAAKDLAIQLNSRCSTVLYVTDESHKGYQFSDIEPPNLVWVERMTPEYMDRETNRMKQSMTEARFGSWLELLPQSMRPSLESVLGGLPNDNELSDFECRRKVVRVPDDPIGAKRGERKGPAALVGSKAPDSPFKRSLERLARVVTRQTVGVALGGGGAWGFCHVALLQNLEEQGIPVDYLTGTSFGSIIGGLYAAGGFAAVKKLVDENSHNPDNPLTPFLSPFTTPLIRMVLLGTISTISIEWFINDHLRRSRRDHPRLVGLATTEIPFYPISSNLTQHEEYAEEHGSVGYGVRLSGTAPPMAPAFRLNGDLIVDGAFVANVPSRHLREIGADFVIAANAVPPAPEQRPPSQGVGWFFDLMMARFNDAMLANQLLTWKAGQDQGELHADVAYDLQPKNSNFIEMWKGRTIAEQVHRDHFSGPNATSLKRAYEAFCAKPIAERMMKW